jgi:hypothetical protein
MPRLRFVLSVLAASALVLSACGGGVESTSSSSSGTTPGGANAAGVDCSATADYCKVRCTPGTDAPLYPAQCPLPSCPCLVGITPRADWAGTYYLPDQADASNLVLEPDGTFHWTIEGCDFGGGDCGTWKRSQPHTIVLQPSPGKTTFQWGSGGGVSATTSVNIASNAGSTDLVVDVPQQGAKPLAARWKLGRICAVCGGGTGPTGQKACTDPVPAQCK